MRQTDDTIAWVSGELNHEQAGLYESYDCNLSTILVEADPGLLLTTEAAIVKARRFLPDLRAACTDAEAGYRDGTY